ncbi:Metallo-dependent phosphatase-like protein [Syncephalis plumigaleata]|nr:Metallo-dependent phosphatase-like protein [Syncephalis plumigaleata]
MKRRVVAVGDLHGDAKNSLAVFRMAGLIDANDRWIAKDTVFVQTGDVIDRGPDTIKLLTFLESLAVQARKTGGRVIQILGNHELMNIGGETKHVSDADFQTFSGKDKRKLAFQQNGKLGKRLFKLPVVHRVADTVFAHGGISVKWATTGLRVTNRQATELMPDYAEKGENLDGYDASVLGPAGPAWYRDFAKEDESKVCKDIAAALKALGVKRMVVGHTFQKNGEVLSRCDNTFIVIDVGISQYAREAKELTEPSSHRALEILPDGTVNIITPEGRTALKSGGKAKDEDEDKPKEKSKDKSKKKDKGKDKDEDE